MGNEWPGHNNHGQWEVIQNRKTRGAKRELGAGDRQSPANHELSENDSSRTQLCLSHPSTGWRIWTERPLMAACSHGGRWNLEQMENGRNNKPNRYAIADLLWMCGFALPLCLLKMGGKISWNSQEAFLITEFSLSKWLEMAPMY